MAARSPRTCSYASLIERDLVKPPNAPINNDSLSASAINANK